MPGKIIRHCGAGVRRSGRGGRHPVKSARIALGRRVSLPFPGFEVNDHAVARIARRLQQVDHCAVVVAVGRSQIVEPHILEVITAVHGILEGFLDPANGAEQPVSDERDLLDEMRGAALGAEVALLLPQARHMHGETSDVLGYGHFILVDDDNKTQSGTHVVECLVDHAACKSTVTHDCHRPGIRAHHPIRLRKAPTGTWSCAPRRSSHTRSPCVW